MKLDVFLPPTTNLKDLSNINTSSAKLNWLFSLKHNQTLILSLELGPQARGRWLEVSEKIQKVLKNIDFLPENIESLQNLVKILEIEDLKEDLLRWGFLFITKQQNYKMWYLGDENMPLVLLRSGNKYKFPFEKSGISGDLQLDDLLLWGEIDLLQNLGWHSFLQKNGGVSYILGGKLQVKKISKIKNLSRKFLNIRHKISQSFFEKQRSSYKLTKKRKIALLISGIFLAALITILFFGAKKRQTQQLQQKSDNLKQQIELQLSQAEGLVQINPSKARLLIVQAQDLLKQAKQATGQALPNSLIQEVDSRINKTLAIVEKKYIIDQPQVFFQLSLINEGFQPQKMAVANDLLILLDQQKKLLASIDLEKKSSQIIAGEKDLSFAKHVAVNDNFWAVADEHNLQVFPIDGGESKEFKFNTVNIDNFVGYASNFYILDKSAQQLWRLRGSKKTLNKPDGFFDDSQAEISNTNQVFIDGSVWFVGKDQFLAKYSSGVRDAFYPSIDVDPTLKNIDAVGFSQEGNNIYLLENNQKRVVVIDKNNQYQAQYFWPQMPNVEAIAVFEKEHQLLLLSGGTIFAIPLQ